MFPRPLGRTLFAASLAALAAAYWNTGTAGATLEVNPVRLTLSHAQPVTALTVRNAGAQPVVLQLKTVAWTQDDGRDEYTPSRELLATPPIFTLAPDAVQTVRVGLRRAPDADQELAYRLYLQEIPGAAPEGTGVRISLRLGVPVFAAPPVDATPRLHWRAERERDGVWLYAHNTGNAHIQIAELALATDGKTPLVNTRSGYILPGENRRWRFDLPAIAAGKTLFLKARTSAGDIDARLVAD